MGLFRKLKKENNIQFDTYLAMIIEEMYPTGYNIELSDLIAEAEDLLKCLNSFLPLDFKTSCKFEEKIEERFIFHSNAIEHNLISREDITKVLKENKVIPGVSLDNHLEAINHIETLRYMKQCIAEKRELNEEILLQMHYLFLKSLNTPRAGMYRRKNITITGSEYIPPSYDILREKMRQYFEFYNKAKTKLHPLILAAEMHGFLCIVHPFIDANGIMARLVSNYILIQSGYPLINISGNRESKIEYYNALEDFHADKERLYKFLTFCVVKSISYYLKSIIPLSSDSKGTYFYEQVGLKMSNKKKEELLRKMKLVKF